MTKVIIIGGSFAGHMALDTLYKVKPDLDVTMVSLSSHAYYNISAPRLLVEPEKLDQTVYPNAEFVKNHSKGKGTFVHGTAISVDLESKTVTVTAESGEQVLKYDFLVIATGTSSEFAGFKVNQSHTKAMDAITETAKLIKESKLVAIIGAGPTGVETAAEIAYAVKSTKVTLYTGSTGPLTALPRLASGANTKLADLGVEIVNSVRSKAVEGTTVHLDNGESRTFDVVLQAVTEKPYSDFLPDLVKDDHGFVVTDKSLVVKGFPDVVALGDIVSGGKRLAVDIKMRQTAVFTATAKRLLGVDPNALKDWTPLDGTVLVPISPNGGEGLIFGWHVPNFLVRMLKAKTFLLDKARKDIL